MNNQYRDKLNWACRDKDARGCLCRVQTTLDGYFVKIKGEHCHEPNFTPENFDFHAPTEPAPIKAEPTPKCSALTNNLDKKPIFRPNDQNSSKCKDKLVA